MPVLIVENEAMLALDLTLELGQGGFDVVGPVATAAGALAVIGVERLAAAVLDLDLKGGAAFPVCRALLDHRVPFLVMGGRRARSAPDWLSAIPTFDKPAEPRHIVAGLRAMMAERQAGRHH